MRYAHVGLLLALLAPIHSALGGTPVSNVIFVDLAAEGAADGASWADAFTDLQGALAVAQRGEDIWVAAGAYTPGDVRSASFALRDDVAIYGGFAGDELPGLFDLNDRDFEASETILSGDLGSGLLAYHVVTAIEIGRTAILDGFTIAHGYADGLSPTRHDVGGGLLVVDASPTIRRCLFLDNRALTKGGAVHLSYSSPLFESCRFIGNESVVTQRTANFGGAVYSEGDILPSGVPTFINCLFTGNQAGVGSGGSGGAIYATTGNRPSLINCTIAGNHADSTGGGVWGASRIVNSIVWGNSDGGTSTRSAQISGSAAVTYSCVQGGWSETGNIEDDPVFVDHLGADGVTGTRDDNLALDAGSPAIDAGDTSALPVDIVRDLNGSPRLVDDPATEDHGVAGSAVAVVDLGACEYQATCSADGDCADGRYCNGDEVCISGVCALGPAIPCDDGVDCTVDACDEETHACVHIGDPTRCDDGLFCDGDEQCDTARGCVAGMPVSCDDGVDCTLDTCDEAADECRHEVDAAACDDGLFCDGVETCDVELGCLSGEPVTCDDSVDCTVDTCDEATRACHFETSDALCDNGLYCDGVETCDVALGCQSGQPIVCDDGIDCTSDRCDESVGACVFEPDDTACDDGVFCDGVESCDAAGGCVPGAAPCPDSICDETGRRCVDCTGDADCDDADPCTDDICDDGACVLSNNAAPCDDGDDCTEDDICADGTCAGSLIPDCGGDNPPDNPPGGGGGPAPPLPPPDPEDTDVDGVPDSIDACPDSPPGEPVDDTGCTCAQRDGDDDGVDDCGDLCLDSPAGNIVDSTGCTTSRGRPAPKPAGENAGRDPASGQNVPDTADSDQDGVADNLDACPDTPAGSAVDEVGCATGPSIPIAGTTICGNCGAVGMLSWTLVLVSLVAFRRRPARRATKRPAIGRKTR